MEEEIKLIIIILLGFCSLWQVRNLGRSSREPSRAVEGGQRMQEEKEERREEEVGVETSIRTEQLLFPPSPKRTIPKPEKQLPYRKCLQGVTFEQDPTTIYSHQLTNQNPFFHPGRRSIRTNQEYLTQIEHMLLEQTTTISNPQPFKYEPPQLIPMSAQEEASTPQQKERRIKRKNITKQHRFGRRQERSKTAPQPQLFSRLPRQQQEPRRKRKGGMMDIDKEIKRRYQEIKILERMKKRGLGE